MQKVKSNASWNELTSEQLETLDRWLFEEKLGYEEVLSKAQTELGYVGSTSSLARYRDRRKQEKLATDFTATVKDAAEIKKLGVEPDAARKAGMMVMGAHFFRMLREAPERVKEWGPVASLLVQNDHNEAWREIKGEEQLLRREALEFAKQRYQNDMVEQALEALPELTELARSRKDAAVSKEEELAQLERIRGKMFAVENKGEHPTNNIEQPTSSGEKAPSTNIQAPEKLQTSIANE